VVRRRENPFAAKKARLSYKALLRREEPLRPTDRDELEAVVTQSIAAGGQFLIYEGMRGDELGCRVIAFDAVSIVRFRAFQTSETALQNLFADITQLPDR
jgi:hypothetical protein